MKEYISIGKNVDTAINDGLISLGLNREDVDIKILETGGLFKKAKVCLMYEEKQSKITKTTVEEVKEIAQEVVEEVKAEQVDESEPIEVDKTIEIDAEQTKTEHVKEVKEVKSPDELIERVKNFLVNLASKMKIEVEVGHVIENNDISFNVEGANVGKLIGYRGETLNAIQVLLGGLKRTGEGRYRLYLDVEGYKKGREQTLVDLANRMADKSEEIERNVHLDPMSAYERRIIHSALQNRTLVETESMGEGDNRHVVIKFKR
ncbi:MAG: RNA-binding cell elongation regulator Jag/EloR [Clostridia bacterium]